MGETTTEPMTVERIAAACNVPSVTAYAKGGGAFLSIRYWTRCGDGLAFYLDHDEQGRPWLTDHGGTAFHHYLRDDLTPDDWRWTDGVAGQCDVEFAEHVCAINDCGVEKTTRYPTVIRKMIGESVADDVARLAQACLLFDAHVRLLKLTRY